MSAARRRALRAVVATLAGGGFTAASLGGPLTGAIAAEAPGVQTAASAETTTPAETTSQPPAAATTPSATATTTTPAPATTAPSTTPAPGPAKPQATPIEPPQVLLKRPQQTSSANKSPAGPNQTSTTAKAKAGEGNNVALSPQAIAAEASALASTEASVQALGFYRIPLFLLPIYKAAAVQYGVPWQILAAINEIETNYGSDLSVSTAGAVGWMQFMPATWLGYGVDALQAGYADPYNPVDAVFAAARYLRAAGAATNLQAAILAYNHSQEYVSSVLLRAKLISAYPRGVIATLTGLVDGRLPVSGGKLTWTALPGSSSATAGATQVGSASPAAPAASPSAVAARTARRPPLRLVTLTSSPTAQVVAVQNGRITKLGVSRELGRYVVLRDVYGDVFTYAGLGSVASSYALPNPAAGTGPTLAKLASKQDPAPSQAATAGYQQPLTLQVKAPRASAARTPQKISAEAPEETSANGKVRLFAHPGNPDARAAAAAGAAARSRRAQAATRLPLRVGSVVSSGTVLGSVNVAKGSSEGHLRFAVLPAGDTASIDPGPVLTNWGLLQSALHPQGAKAADALLGATASDVFLLSKSELQRTVLSDPGIAIDACARHEVAAGAIDKRVLAVLAFLSRSGLKPTVSALRCGQSAVAASGAASADYQGDAVEISAVNGTPIAGHQGTATITDLTIRTLLTLPSEFLPSSIVSLMRYPGAPSTRSSSAYWNRVRLEFPAAAAAPVAISPSAAGRGARAAQARRLATAALLGGGSTLTAAQWDQLVERIGGLSSPTIARKPSSAAIPDPKQK